ncbi:isochorismate synthase MenF [Endozoicomonas sp. OPT23]|uniref:isochorismate synthase n=1 Tax=Endozoicomonas sp. OPT23 TaxID=2072845 RepID=UPI00189162C9|nr:isochorismate synthase [Endozoicomonas sp. OPT23]
MINEVENQAAELIKHLQALEDSYQSDSALLRVELPLPMINLFSWLSTQSFSGRCYWQDRNSDIKIAGLGRSWSQVVNNKEEAGEVFLTAHSKLPESGRCLSYLSFSDKPHMVWPQFGYGEFFVPLIEIVQRRKGCFLACNLSRDSKEAWRESLSQARQCLETINWQLTDPDWDYMLAAPRFRPCPDRWQSLMEKTMAAIGQNNLKKVVLSRETRMALNGHLDLWVLLQQWQVINPRSYVFAFEADNGDFFFGCSPERLFSRVDGVIHTEALAGTTSRGESRDEDFRLELRLLNDAKNIHENNLVLDDIRQRLNEVCDSLEFDRSHSVVKLKRIQHLRHLIRGVLKQHIGDGELFSALHPTPAVGGTGREEAMAFIESEEGYSRGLYAGTCGVIGDRKSEFTVSIRSALLRNNSLSLFSGAGIVDGSKAWEEWSELNNKIATLLTLLGEQEIPESCWNSQETINSTGFAHDFSHQAS